MARLRDVRHLGQAASLEGDEGGGQHRDAAVAAREEEDPLPVGVPALDPVGAGVPGEPPRRPSLDGHQVDVGVPLVLPGEGDPLPVGAQAGVRFRPGAAGEAGRLSPSAADRPEVPGVDEDDPIDGDRRVLEEESLGGRVLAAGRGTGERDGGEGGDQGVASEVHAGSPGAGNAAG